jgi:hypothetical protein
MIDSEEWDDPEMRDLSPTSQNLIGLTALLISVVVFTAILVALAESIAAALSVDPIIPAIGLYVIFYLLVMRTDLGDSIYEGSIDVVEGRLR